MEKLSIKPTHKPIQNYYEMLNRYENYNIIHEGAVSHPFAILLNVYAGRVNATFVPQYQMRTPEGKRIIIDGAILDEYGLPLAYWEAKDMDDDLPKEIQKKRRAGYPFDNILFQSPQRAILYQDGQKVLDIDITEPPNLVESLQSLFSHPDIAYGDWYTAVTNFKDQINALATDLQKLVVNEHKENKEFREAFGEFHRTCRASINPNLSKEEVEEMLVQHILTERIFRKVFEMSDFTSRNIIAVEIERVSAELMKHFRSRDEFLKPLDRYYTAIEYASERCRNFSQKQHFLNTVYEKFFQDFSEDVADTHGIVYTPQPIVNFMVKSVEYLLQSEFKRSLSDTCVHVIDPFVGTGNFIVRLMQDIKTTALEEKYQHELHCNEVLLLPYYIANLNIEQEFWQRTQKHQSFEGIAFADTFELFDQPQRELFTEENTKRVDRQKEQDMFVVIGNPPYNARQESENDNNKNRPYPVIDKHIGDTYVKDSKAQLKYNVYDPYVRAFSWASERIGSSGIVALITNNTFIDGLAFDGMRKHLAEKFNALYLINLGGNIYKGQPADSNVFDIEVGVSIAILVRTGEPIDIDSPCIFYNDETELQSKAQTFDFLNKHQNVGKVKSWQEIRPNANYTWLTEGLHADFNDLVPMGTKTAKKKKGIAEDVIFKTFSLGVSTNRDDWVYNFNQDSLCKNVQRMLETYTAEMDRWDRQKPPKPEINDFVEPDVREIKWSDTLKKHLKAGHSTDFTKGVVRRSLYRPFTKTNLFLDKILIDRPGQFGTIFPTAETETENRVICVNMTPEKPFTCLIADCVPNLVVTGGYGSPTQCFPFFTYNQDGGYRRENITDWALESFQNHYEDDSITKWDIFYYNYGILHHPDYRDKYREDLKRNFPRIPFAEEFWAFAKAGEQLAELHINYESVPKYIGLTLKETPNMSLDWNVENMKLSKDKTQIQYNDLITIEGIPAEAHEYRLGNRSALEWIVDQYKIEYNKDTARRKGSHIVNDPNSEENPQYIVDLIACIITVSLETVKIIKSLPVLYSVDER